jgi:hypothetical protein
MSAPGERTDQLAANLLDALKEAAVVGEPVTTAAFG